MRHDTRQSVCVTLAVPPELAETFRFTQGQYLTLRRVFDGEEVRRTYSICSAVGEPDLRIGIKRVPGGAFSCWANDELAAGDTVEAMPPLGTFSVPLAPGERRRYVAFAAGSGITPILSIVRTTLEREPLGEFTLFYGNRASSTIMFREELEALKDRFLGRFNLAFVMSREEQDIDLLNGRLTREKCDALLDKWVDARTLSYAFVCGPDTMIDEATAALVGHGVPRERIRTERFAPGPASSRSRRPEAAETGEPATVEVTAILDGRTHRFALRKDAESVLEAGLRQGVALPYSCKGGICSTCRARLVAGEVDMDATYALEDYEVANGYVLCCQSYPVTDRVTVDFDQGT